MSATKQAATTKRAAAPTGPKVRKPQPVEENPPPPKKASVTVSTSVPADARTQRLNETAATRGVVIPAPGEERTNG